MQRLLIRVLFLALLITPVVATAIELPPGVTVIKSNMVPMRDGTALSTDLYMPVAEKEKLPVILLATVDGKNTAFDNNPILNSLLERGYVIAVQDIGGRYESGGEYVPATNRREDGYDTVDWLIAQDWSNQKVGSAGCSFLGETQVVLAAAKHPNHLTAIPVSSGSGYYAPDRAKLPPTGRENVATSPSDAEYFRKMDFVQASDTIDIPSLFMNSWYDNGVAGSLTLFKQFQKNGLSERSRNNQFIIIGPGTHCGYANVSEHTNAGARDLGDARLDIEDIQLRWYDYWLKDIDNDITAMPRVQYFLMGKNEWRSSDQWPLANTRYKKLYLASGGQANSRMGDGVLSFIAPVKGPTDKFVYDPATPVPSWGGHICSASDAASGSYDQSAIEMRNDVLVYTSDVLEQGIEVTGKLRVVLHVSSTAVDTDFTAKLVDVGPDGKAFNIQEGAMRMRYRDGLDQKVMMVPGKVYEIHLDLHPSSNYFDKGHRIRLEVSSSNFPRWERNLNTGGNNFDDTEWQLATNKVFHMRRLLSYIVLPVIEDAP